MGCCECFRPAWTFESRIMGIGIAKNRKGWHDVSYSRHWILSVYFCVIEWIRCQGARVGLKRLRYTILESDAKTARTKSHSCVNFSYNNLPFSLKVLYGVIFMSLFYA